MILPYVESLRFPRWEGVIGSKGRLIPLPLPYVEGSGLYFWHRYVADLVYIKRNAIPLSNGLFFHRSLDIEVNFHFLDIIRKEYASRWLKHYRPPKERAIVLDAGAGYGETASVFFKRFKARKLVCIEPNFERFRVLARNCQANGWNVELINDVLRPEHLQGIDFAKIDIEGSEHDHSLIESLTLPCAVEVHGRVARRCFAKKGFREVWRNRMNAIMTNSL